MKFAPADAVIFDYLPPGMRAGSLSKLAHGSWQWIPCAVIAADADIVVEADDVPMTAAIPGYGRLA